MKHYELVTVFYIPDLTASLSLSPVHFSTLQTSGEKLPEDVQCVILGRLLLSQHIHGAFH